MNAQKHWLDIWLPRISHFSQFGLFVVTLGSLYFVVLPLYQKAVLDEAIARKEIELKESNELLEQSYKKIRSYAVMQFTASAAAKCILNLRAFNSEEDLSKSETSLNMNVSNCLNGEATISEELKQLRPNDQHTFSAALEKVIMEIEQKRSIALNEYLGLPARAKLDPSLLKPPKHFSAAMINAMEEFSKKTRLISEANISKQRFKAGIHAAQLDLESEFKEFSIKKIKGLRLLNWSSP